MNQVRFSNRSNLTLSFLNTSNTLPDSRSLNNSDDCQGTKHSESSYNSGISVLNLFLSLSCINYKHVLYSVFGVCFISKQSVSFPNGLFHLPFICVLFEFCISFIWKCYVSFIFGIFCGHGFPYR